MRHTWLRWMGIGLIAIAAGCGSDGGGGGGGGGGPCASDDDCTGAYCAAGRCVYDCTRDSECEGDERCSPAGRCIAGIPGGDAGAGGVDAGPIDCVTDADCDDGLYCNGAERCAESVCAAGEAVDCDDGVACTTDDCSETTRACTHGSSDADGDSFIAVGCGDGNDCDDTDDTIHPGAAEDCDAVDDDCDPATLGGTDEDADTYVSAACCNGAGNCGGDCDDANSDVHPAVTEACNRIDDNCDGTTDEGVTVPLYLDADMDSYGTGEAMMLCADTAGFVPMGGDCDDSDDQRNPGVVEVCNGVDEDCDVTVDEGAMTVYTVDADGDGYGSSAMGAATMSACARPAGYAMTADDCDDATGSTHPGAREFCDGAMVDDDCDAMRNEGCACVTGTTRACCGTRGTETCEMTDSGSVWGACSVTAATEVCNRIDDDCDGTVDDGASARCPATGQTCTSGMCVCPSGQVACGGRCQAVGGPCDGSDGDSCVEGVYACESDGVVRCSDRTASTHLDRQCGSDLDCDGNAYENIDCGPGATRACSNACSAIAGTYHFFESGSETCGSGCTFDSGCRTSPMTGINQPPGWSPWVVYTGFGNCGGSIVGGRDYQNPYTFASWDCPIANINSVELAPGRYDIQIDHFDSAVLVTPRIRVQVGTAFDRIISNTVGGWEYHRYTFTVTGCQNANLAITSLATYYDGSSGGSAGWYRGGDTIGNIRIYGPY